MADKFENPFLYTGLADSEHSAPRPELAAALHESFASKQNLLVQGPRRVGKTSLIVNTFKALEAKRQCWFVEVDFYGVPDRLRVIEKLQRAIHQLPLSSSVRVKVQRLLGSLREFGFAGFKAGWQGGASALEDLLEVLTEINKHRPVVVLFDEFQALTEIADAADVLGSMRSIIQRQQDICYLFAGSDQNSLREMFFVEKNPFLKSVAVLEVGVIEREPMIGWLEQRFKSGKRKVDGAVWAPMFDFVYDLPGDVQQICHTLWETSEPGDTLDLSGLDRAVQRITDMQGSSFRDLWGVLATNQRRFLLGLARVSDAGPTTRGFLDASGIANAATSQRAMHAMLDKGVLWNRDRALLFANPFLRYWILCQ